MEGAFFAIKIGPRGSFTMGVHFPSHTGNKRPFIINIDSFVNDLGGLAWHSYYPVLQENCFLTGDSNSFLQESSCI